MPLGAKLPSRGDRVKAKDLAEIANLAKRAGRVGENQYNGAHPLFYPPFHPILKMENGVISVSVKEGYVIERLVADVTGGLQIVYHIPDNIIDPVTDEVVWQEMTEDQALYVKFSTDSKGVITGTPSVELDIKEFDQVHFKPEVGDFSGEAGTHAYKICEFVLTDYGMPDLTTYQSGNHVEHYAERVTMINLSDATSGATEYNVLKDYDSASDTINFRNIEQRDDDGETIIAEDGDDSIPFKRIGDRVTSVQINVTTVGDKVQIEGNGVDGDNDSVTVVDGLVSAVKAQNAGIWGNILFTYYDDAGGGAGNCDLTMYFENGRLISVDGTNVTGTGTEIDQIDATFTSRDTDT